MKYSFHIDFDKMLAKVLGFAFWTVAFAAAYTGNIHDGMDPKDLIAKVNKCILFV